MLKALLGDQLTWNIPLFILFISLTVMYMIYVKRNNLLSKYMQPILFLFGIWLLYLAIGSPLLAISYLSFSLHMIQMSFLFFIIPPLILLGIPQVLYEKIITMPIIKKGSIFNVTPHLSLIIFAGLFLLYHFPFFLIFISQFPLLQKVYLAFLFLLTFRMWWPVVSPDSKQRLLSADKKKYVLQSSLYIMPACLMFIISAFFVGINNPHLADVMVHLCIPADSSIQILPPPFNTKYDQMLAGTLMIGLHKFGLFMTGKLVPIS